MHARHTESAPASALPPVGRHTQALESKTPEVPRVRKPSLQETPDLKKPKIEIPDEDMIPTHAVDPTAIPVEPGHVDTQSTEPDVDIPKSPHFASAPSVVAHYDLTMDDEHDVVSQVDPVQNAPRKSFPHEELTTAVNEHALPTIAPLSGARPLIDNSLIHNPTAKPNSAPLQAGPPQPGAGIASWAFGSDKSKGSAYSSAPEQMPPWIQDIRDGFLGLHQKADQIHNEMCRYGADIQAQSVRISNLEQVASEHSSKHDSSEARINALEAKIESLIAQNESLVSKGDLRSRSPSRTGLGTGNRSPSPRSPRFINRGEFMGWNDDFDVVVGGWNDARKSDAFEEIKNIFKAIDFEGAIQEVWAPYNRTSFAKVTLSFPDPNAHLNVKRQFQTQIITKIKARNFQSGVPGSEGNKVWATRSKTPDERAKIRAVVLTKAFYKTQSPGEGLPNFNDEDIEISWAGKVYIDRFQLLGSVERDGEPRPYDTCIEDAKGNHMNWYIKADVFAQVTKKPKESLQEIRLSAGPTTAHARLES